MDVDHDFQLMSPDHVPFQEDPKQVLLRDWPPLFGVRLQYVASGLYLSSKKGALQISTKPSTKWKFIATYAGYIIQDSKKQLALHMQSAGKLSLVVPKVDGLGEWRVTPSIDNNRVVLRIKSATVGGVLILEDEKAPKPPKSDLDGLWAVEVPQDLGLPLYQCPECKKDGLHEDALWYHWAQVHPRKGPENLPCPICTARYGDATPQGDSSWGYGNHLFHNHGPHSRKAVQPGVSRKNPVYQFSLVIIQHPKTKKFVIVEEGANAGWWLPAGGVDPGEGFVEAALRECVEEAGIAITLKGIICLENGPRPKGGGRQRMIFLAEPTDPDAPLKSVPDYESVQAVWTSYEELHDDIKAGKKHLRGKEPYKWFKYIEDGGAVYPLSLLYESPAI